MLSIDGVLRHTDQPRPAGLDVLAMLEGDRNWFVQPKLNGWRTWFYWDGTTATATSRRGEPIPWSMECKAEFEGWMPPGQKILLDGEWMGRRAGAAESVHFFDLLYQHAWLGNVPLQHRIVSLVTALRWDAKSRLSEAACGAFDRSWVPFHECRRLRAFFDECRAKAPAVEGVVLKHKNSLYIGSPRKCTENLMWLKVRFLGGAAGDTVIA